MAALFQIAALVITQPAQARKPIGSVTSGPSYWNNQNVSGNITGLLAVDNANDCGGASPCLANIQSILSYPTPITDANDYANRIVTAVFFNPDKAIQAGAAYIIETTLKGYQPGILNNVNNAINQARTDAGTFAAWIQSYEPATGTPLFMIDQVKNLPSNLAGHGEYMLLPGAGNTANDDPIDVSIDPGQLQDLTVIAFLNPADPKKVLYAVSLLFGGTIGDANALPTVGPTSNISIEGYTQPFSQTEKLGMPSPLTQACVYPAVVQNGGIVGLNNNNCNGSLVSANFFVPQSALKTGVADGLFLTNTVALPADYEVSSVGACVFGQVPNNYNFYVQCGNGETPLQPFLGLYFFNLHGTNSGKLNVRIRWHYRQKAPSGGSVKAYPWLQVENGDVAAMGRIIGQQAGLPGSRKVGDPINTNTPSREAEYVVIASMNANAFATGKLNEYGTAPNPGDPGLDNAVTNFCSRSTNYPGFERYGIYNFGVRNNNANDGTNPFCTSGNYILNLNNDLLKPPPSSDDSIIANFLTVTQNSVRTFSSPILSCSAFQPYLVYDWSYNPFNKTGTYPNINPRNKFQNGFPNPPDCPGVWVPNNVYSLNPPASFTLNSMQINQGRATLLVKGDLFINGDVTYNYTGTYNHLNDLPNLGIIVNGNVFIDSSVTRIDSNIYAKGYIDTCVNWPQGVVRSCSKQLGVHGSLIAKGGFRFGRTFQNQPANNPAESIITNGQFLLVPPPGFENRLGRSATAPQITSEDIPRGK